MYIPEIRLVDAQYYEADSCEEWSCSANFGTFLQNFEVSCDRLGPSLRNDVTTLVSLNISGIGLVFGGMLHSTIKQNDI